MGSLSRIILGVLLFSAAGWFCDPGRFAHARGPEHPAERSLLYWRYLCRGSVQSERIVNGRRELHCEGQGWTVIGPENSGWMDEVRHAPK
ncbi:hypothetical protein EB061_08140 [bacterium]|jgi:hypothetical protein|nr:hypothetical protein [bacterium]